MNEYWIAKFIRKVTISLQAAIMITVTPACLPAYGQSTMKLSDIHISKVNKASNASRKLALYRKYFTKDSIKYVRAMKRYWQSKTDSISNYYSKHEKALADKQKAVKDGINTRIYNTVYRPWAIKQARTQLQWLERNNIMVSEQSRRLLLRYFEDYFLAASQDDQMLAALKEKMPGLPLPKQLTSKLNAHNILNLQKVRDLAGKKLPAQNVMGKFNEVQEKAQGYGNKLDQYGKYAKAFSNTDSLKGFAQARGEEFVSQNVSRLDGVSELGAAQSELNKLKAMPGQYKTSVEQLQDSAYIKEQARQKAEELAMKYISDHPEILQGVQRKMGLLMKKYSIVPNSNDLSTAVKRTSLRGQSLSERLYFAGNLQLLSFDPITIDFSPMVGYRFNTRFLAGVGGNYRQSFSDSIPTLARTVLGYRAFASYDVIRNFFAYAEFDRNSPGVKRTESSSQIIWKNAAFLGIGRKVMIRPKLEMTFVMIYNFLHEHNDPIYPRAWSLRVGFQTSALAFLKAKPRF